jgi:hypothetical protein
MSPTSLADMIDEQDREDEPRPVAPNVGTTAAGIVEGKEAA